MLGQKTDKIIHPSGHTVSHPFFESTTRVEVEVIAGVHGGVHVLEEGVGRVDAAARVTHVLLRALFDALKLGSIF